MGKLTLMILLVLLVRLLPISAAPSPVFRPNDIITYASAQDKDNYLRLGSVTELDGYTRMSTHTDESPICVHRYTPVDEGDPLTRFVISGAVLTPEEMCSYLTAYYSAFADSISESIQTEVDGRAAIICSMTASAYVEEGAMEEEAESAIFAERTLPPNRFFQHISMYISTDDTHSIGVNAYLQGSGDSFYLADEALEAYMCNLAQVIAFPEK